MWLSRGVTSRDLFVVSLGQAVPHRRQVVSLYPQTRLKSVFQSSQLTLVKGKMRDLMEDEYLDCRAISCPMPIVRISRAAKELSQGQQIKVEATDPSFQADLEAWIRKSGNELVSFTTEDGLHTAIIKIAE